MKIVIIGAGPAGRFASMYAAEKGNDVTLIENRYIGGKCLNQACMVVCALSDVTKHIRDAENFNDIGVFDVKPTVNFERVTEHIKDTQKKIRKIITNETIGTGVEFVQGTASVDSVNKVVRVLDDEYPYDKLLVCTGSSPLIPRIKGVENALTYADTLKLKEVPEKLVIIGGGSTAAEYAGIFSHMGSQVDILCRSHFLKVLNDNESEEYIVSKMLKNTMIHENVEIKEITDRSVITNYGEIEGTVLLATGVTPNSDIVKDIVQLDENGHIIVDEHLQTSNKDIYAAGDVIGRILSTPVSRMEGMAAIKNIMGENITPDYSLIPMTITLPYDVSYLLGTDVNENGKTVKLPGAAGPGTFWHTLEGNTGFTKENINMQSNEINNIIAISPSSNIALPYMIKMIKDNVKSNEFDNFLEIHPSTDGISKLTEYYKRYSK
ncbi:MAG: NAD(P)/FAD-dependent oxidoreductase [Methanosphaera sp.]|nr:NAD(P)/FAD-dependent oxidoreductase [Methanosphaera sp.]